MAYGVNTPYRRSRNLLLLFLKRLWLEKGASHVALRGAALRRAARFLGGRFANAPGAETNAIAQLRLSRVSGLILACMFRWPRMIWNAVTRLFRSPQAPVDRSRLVGMYLSQANTEVNSPTRGSRTRERQEGKFSQNRRRG